MKDKEFLEFLTAPEEVPSKLKGDVHKDITLSFKGTQLMLKMASYQVLGAMVSLAFCPQFGLGFFSAQGHHMTHHLKLIHDCLCALYCGTLFLSAGVILSFIFMKGEELAWIWRRKKVLTIILPTTFWAVLMLFNVSMDLPEENGLYHLTWIAAGVFAQVLWLKARTFFYRTA